MEKNILIDYFNNIKDLENRRITYDKAISEVEQEIKKAKVYNSYAQPNYPSIDYRFSRFRFGVFWFINCFIIGFILLCILSNTNLSENVSINISVFSASVISLIITICFEVHLHSEACKKAERQYQEECQKVNTYNRQQKEMADQRTELLIKEKTPDLNDWKSFNFRIDLALSNLYKTQVIPEKYQNAVAVSFFVSYLESGRCDTLKECMNKYDDDAMYYQLKGRIEDILQRIDKMEVRLSREIRYLKKDFQDGLDDLQILVDNNNSQLDRISYNQKTNELLSTALLLNDL